MKKNLLGKGLEVVNLGTHQTAAVNYPDITFAVEEQVAQGVFTIGPCFLCGTGIGMAISANKVPEACYKTGEKSQI